MTDSIRSTEALLNVAVIAVRKGEQVLRRKAQRLDRLGIAEKEDNPTNLVTQADTEVESTVVDELLHFYRRDRIIAEERSEGEDINAMLDEPEGRTWVLDPIDGTTNFIHGYPHYAIGLACIENRRVKLAVVANVATGELYTAMKGRGARINDQMIRVSGRFNLRGALLANSSHPSPNSTMEHDNLATYRDLYNRQLTIRRTGSVILDMANVAMGRLDGFWGSGLKPWDMAAGALLVSESGGMVSDFSAGDSWMKTGQIICGTPKCYAGILKSVLEQSTERTGSEAL